MKRLERILAAIAAIAIVMKVIHIPLSGFFLINSLSLLAMSYFGFGWLIFPTPTRKDQVVPLSIVAGLTLFLLLIGILFKLQVWPLSGFYLLVGLVAGIGVVLISYLVGRNKPELEAYFRGLSRRLLIVIVIAAGLYPISSRALLHFYYRDQPRRAELLDSLHRVEDPATRERLERELYEMEGRP
jgi:hypothetical protein